MYGGLPYAGGPHAGALVSEADIPDDGNIYTAVEIAFTTAPLDPSPAFVDIGGDCRWWDTLRGRSGELERFQPGRATVVLDNAARQYDSVNAAGPWYGYLKPMRRIRIRETLNGVTYPQFDGYVDGWQLDYPNVGTDATATVTATDLFKILARHDLGRSVYALEVAADAPLVWYHLDDEATVTGPPNKGTLGQAGDGTYMPGMKAFKREAIVVNDPGGSVEVQQGWSTPSTVSPKSGGVYLPSTALNLANYPAWAIEMWVLALEAAPPAPAANRLFTGDTLAASVNILTQASAASLQFTFAVANSGGTTYGVVHPTTWQQGRIYHVVCKMDSTGQLAIYVNGVRSNALAAGAAATIFTGTQVVRDLGFGYDFEAFQSAGMLMSNIAIYGVASGDPLSDARVTAHYLAGSAPWSGDDGDDRIGRILDLAAVPAGLRVLDDGDVTLQSAEITGQTALEHVQKVGETEFPQVWITRAGEVRFPNKTTLFAREPAVTFGDEAGEVGYRDLTPDDGGDYVRNRATISRYAGAARTSTDPDSIDDYGQVDYTLEGLLHASDDYSQNYADLVVLEYGDPRRRISNLEIGAPVVGDETAGWPALLGLELQEAVTVKHAPPGGGDRYEQVCAIEGIRHTSRPGEERTASLTLSPEFAARDWEDSVQIGYAEVTANQTGITSDVDITGLSVPVTIAAGRRIRISAEGLFAQSAGSPTYATLYIKEGATQLQGFRCDNPTNTARSCTPSVVLTPSAGAHTYKLSGGPDAGTVIFVASAIFPAFILVEDIGPA